ncbi:MAG: hypothetical protein E7246_06410 [Lachnoclostridium sp.]|nr:hypothetical protein [Lachnoclostridium sp.]
MRKAILLGLISLMILAVVSGCGNKDTRDFLIENHNWTFVNMVDSESGTVTACAKDQTELYPEAEVLELTCKASTNVLAIRDKETGNGKEISYSGIGKDTNAIIYELVLVDREETIEGMAVSSITEYAKGKYEYTLIIDIDGKALYFVDRETE